MSLSLEQILLKREELPIVHNGRFVTPAPIHPVLRNPELGFDKGNISIAALLAVSDWRLDMEEQSKMDTPYADHTRSFLEKLSSKQTAHFTGYSIDLQPVDYNMDVSFYTNGFINSIRWVVPHIYMGNRDAYMEGRFSDEKKEFYKRSRKFERHNFHVTPFAIDSLLNRIVMHTANMGMIRAYEKGLLKL